MDLALETAPIEPVFESAGENIQIETGTGTEPETGEELNVTSLNDKKKARCGVVEMKKRVAELVLVLSAMAEMRGGKKPVLREMEMMEEARAKVAAMCETLKPRDVVKIESIGGVIEELGLKRKGSETNLGFRPCMMSISEKYSLAKRSMEESKEFASHSRTYLTQKLQTGDGTVAENRGTSHTNGLGLTNKSISAPTASGGVSTAPRIGSSTYQLPTNQNQLPTIKNQLPTNQNQLPANQNSRPSVTSSGLPGSRLVRDSSSVVAGRSVERANFRLGQRVVPGQDTSIDQASIKVEGAVPKVVAPAPPVSYTHKDIGNIVHKFLQSRLPKQQTWTPPSRDYMRKSLNCQICELTLNEVHNLLVCDSCEKGFHLKCLQATNQNGAPRGEWHCPKCLTLSNGKPLPPKYGCVMRNTATPKLPVL